MSRLVADAKTPALVAWEGRRKRHEHDAVTDNSTVRAGAPMFFTCHACYGQIILAEDYLTSQAICYDCRDLLDAGWIAQRPDGEWVRT